MNPPTSPQLDAQTTPRLQPRTRPRMSSPPISQQGKLAVITGATGGLGWETALALAQAGARVVLTGRNAEKGSAALAAIRARYPHADIRYAHLDLASLSSVADFAGRFLGEHASLDLLVNNAGVMMPPQREMTRDGFELQMGTNYLGHYALTARLLPALSAAAAARVVNLSSLAHRGGAIDFDDLQSQKRYRPWAAYRQSKLAMLMFTFELQRQSDAQAWRLLGAAAHPGLARTDIIANGPGAASLLMRVNRLLGSWASQSAQAGALPTLYAATAPGVAGGDYYGPDGFQEVKGAVAPAFVARQARDEKAAARLWAISAQLTGVQWAKAPLPADGKTR